MKKISALIALAMVVTIGGVYATWNYATGAVASVDTTASVVLTEKVVETPKGTIAIDASSLEMAIDDTNGDYDAELVIDGDVKVTFTPSSIAPEDVKTNGIKLKCELSVTTPWEYEGTQIFTVSPVVINDGNATLSATITAADLMDAITLGDITLDTVEAYDAFEAILQNGEITMTVSEVQ